MPILYLKAVPSILSKRSSVATHLSDLSTALTKRCSSCFRPGTSRSLISGPVYQTRPLTDPRNRLTSSITCIRTVLSVGNRAEKRREGNALSEPVP